MARTREIDDLAKNAKCRSELDNNSEHKRLEGTRRQCRASLEKANSKVRIILPKIEGSIEIKATKERVWEVISDLDHEPDYWWGTKAVFLEMKLI